MFGAIRCYVPACHLACDAAQYRPSHVMFQHATSHAMRHNIDSPTPTAPIPPVSPQRLARLENLQHMALKQQPDVSSVAVFCDAYVHTRSVVATVCPRCRVFDQPWLSLVVCLYKSPALTYIRRIVQRTDRKPRL